jgi:hypothetical protein
MADSDANKSPDEIPTFKFSPKKVDDSWKEEARREREAAAKAAAAPAARPGAPKAAAPKPAAAAAPAQDHGHSHGDGEAHDHGHSHGGEEAGAVPAKPESKQSPAEQQQTKIFLTFLAGLAQQALMQLGEIESPFSGQRELDINGARYTIEILAVIQIKTAGNLTADEAQMLEETIADLKMRYVEIAQELQRQMAAQVAKGGPGAGPGGPGGMRPGPGGSIGGRR